MMSKDGKLICPRLMLSITHTDNVKKLEKILDSLGLPVVYQCRGMGTAPSEIMDIFGLTGTGRLITLCILSKSQVKEVFRQLDEKMSLKKKGEGIAVTLPLNGLPNHILDMLAREIENAPQEHIEGDETEMKESSPYSVIWISVSSGYCDDVVNAARNAGARGATVLKGKRRASEEAAQNWGVPLLEEQDFVLIVVPREKKKDIMTAVAGACGIKTQAHGIILSAPVDEVIGLA